MKEEQERTRSASSQSSTSRRHQKQNDKYKPSTEKQTIVQTTNSNDEDLPELNKIGHKTEFDMKPILKKY